MHYHTIKIKRKLLFCLIFSLFFIHAYQINAAPIGKITAIIGDVDITAPGQMPRPAELDGPVNEGDIIRTRDLSKAEIRFMDGNVMHLASSCELEITEYYVGLGRMTSLIKLFSGKIRNIINLTVGRSFGAQELNRFEVHTPTAVIGVRGTDFFTYHNNGISGSTFKQGNGYCFSMNRPGDLVYIAAGQSMTVESPDIIPVVRPASGLDIKTLEQETSPLNDEKTLSDENRGETNNDELQETIGNDTTDESILRKGIDDEIRNMDRPDRGIEIPREVPVPEHEHSHMY